MEAKKQASEGTPFNADKRIMDYLRVCTWNVRILNKDGASAHLAVALIECSANIIGQECKSYMRRGANSDAGSCLARAFDTLSQVSPW